MVQASTIINTVKETAPKILKFVFFYYLFCDKIVKAYFLPFWTGTNVFNFKSIIALIFFQIAN